MVDGDNVLLIEQEPLEKIKTDVDAVKGVLENLDPEHVAIAVKAIPILLPDAIDHTSYTKTGTLYKTRCVCYISVYFTDKNKIL